MNKDACNLLYLMMTYLLKRLLHGIPVIMGVMTISFIISYIIPGDPVLALVGDFYDEATIDNGCIYVLPKSHKPPFHEDRVYVTAKPGDITFLHNYVIHGSHNNNSKEFRRNLLLMYVKKGCEFHKGEGAEREEITNG